MMTEILAKKKFLKQRNGNDAETKSLQSIINHY